MRPDRLVLVTGTGTGVGKTWVAAALAASWRAAGATVAARKPALSFGPGAAGEAAGAGTAGGHATDAEVLAAATGEDPWDVCPEHRRYPLAMAPPMAAGALGRPSFTVADLAGELRWSPGAVLDDYPAGERPPGAKVHDQPGGELARQPRLAARYGLVESVGGPRSPLASDGDTVTLAELLHPDHVVLVADAGLGTINAVLLSAAALARWRPAVILNRFDEDAPVHVLNMEWLRRHTDLIVTTDVGEIAARL